MSEFIHTDIILSYDGKLRKCLKECIFPNVMDSVDYGIERLIENHNFDECLIKLYYNNFIFNSIRITPNVLYNEFTTVYLSKGGRVVKTENFKI